MINQECLQDALGGEASAEVMALYGKLPNGQVELLKIIAALISGSTGAIVDGNIATFLGSENLVVPAGGNTHFATIPAGATLAVVTVYGNDVVFVLDASAPDYTISNGHLVQEGTTININSADLSLVEFNPIDATSANLYISYFK